SYRKYNVSGTTSFSFSPAAPTVRAKAAVNAWTGATLVGIEPAPGTDGVGVVAYKVTNTSPGVWHYEYAIYNQNMDRGVQSFSVPVAADANLSNIGFHAPPQHPGWTFDGTFNNAGYSSAPWTQTQANGTMTWNSETFAQNQNANAIRWGTMYNFRFDSNRPPQAVNATIGFFKTGEPITVQIQAPGAPAQAVSVSGRVLTSSGAGVYNARVTISDGSTTRTVITNNLGYYRFPSVMSGSSYTMGVTPKRRYTFASRSVLVSGNLSGVDFVAAP
ncbi:MAG TPA: carboxypeptidase-like regulatory domain-containing protein, partial [Pyrinomonadaceae bacterium]|nr:carboxypeptidase-like regulatory domain-containing protein [Pyrinomonadaceae bacterium]